MVRDKVEAAFRRFMMRDGALLTMKANERSITHQFAKYIEEQFPDYHVDCEYNRCGLDPKRLDTFKRHVDSADSRGVTVYPDIIVHHRGTANNLLVIEAKLSSSVEDCQKVDTCNCDHCKLQAYKRELGYCHAYFVEFPVDEKIAAFSEASLAEYVTEVS